MIEMREIEMREIEVPADLRAEGRIKVPLNLERDRRREPAANRQRAFCWAMGTPAQAIFCGRTSAPRRRGIQAFQGRCGDVRLQGGREHPVRHTNGRTTCLRAPTM
jgi:hypothetical protein